MNDRKDFNNLKSWLPAKIKARNLGMQEFADKARISRSALYHFTNDTRRPDEPTIARICKALGVPIEEGKAQYTPRAKGRPVGSKNRKVKRDTGSRVEQPADVAVGTDL